MKKLDFDDLIPPLTPEQKAFLDTVAGSEGPDYQTIHGGKKFDDFTDHPRYAAPIMSGPNAGQRSTAAGRYQFLANTWDAERDELGLPDFSPDSQDRAAWNLADKTYRARTGRALLDDVQGVRVDPQALSGIWTSLPGGIEPNRATASFQQRLRDNLSARVQDSDFRDLIPPISQREGEGTPTARVPADTVGPLFDDLVPAPEQTHLDEHARATHTPSTGEYVKENVRDVAIGAKDFAGTTLQGAGALTTRMGEQFVNATLESIRRIEAGEQLSGVEDVLGYQDMSPEQRATIKAELEHSALQPRMEVKNSPLYKAGEAVQDWGKEGWARAGAGFEGPSLRRDLARGLGSMGAGLGALAVPGVGPGLAAGTFTMAGAGEAAQRAIKAGATDEEVYRASRLGTAAGATEMADALLLSTGAVGKAMGLIKKVGTQALKGAYTQGGQEGLQQFIQNTIAKGVYKPEQDLTEDVAYNALIGGILGGGVSGVGAAVSGERGASADAKTQALEDLEAQMASHQREHPTLFASAAPPERQMQASPIFYSQVEKTIKAGPAAATAEQWEATLRQTPGVKQEELELTKVAEFLREHRGQKVTKDDLTVAFTPVIVEEVSSEGDVPKYGRWVTPGPATDPIELRLRVRPRDEYDVTEDEHWPGEENVIAHVRADRRVTTNGQPVLHIQEIQSALHQAGAQEGYRPTKPAKRQLYEELHAAERRLHELLRETYKLSAKEQEMRPEIVEIRDELRRVSNLLYGQREGSDQRPSSAIPFKDTWQDLALKRMLRYAADNGFTKIAWSTGDSAFRYNTGIAAAPIAPDSETTTNLRKGLEYNYDKVISSRMKKLTRPFGGVYAIEYISDGAEQFFPGDSAPIPVHTITVSPELMSNVRKGQRLFSKAKEQKREKWKDKRLKTEIIVEEGVAEQIETNWTAEAGTRIAQVLQDLGRRLGLRGNLEIRLRHDLTGVNFGFVEHYQDGGMYAITLNTALHNNPSELYATAAHEFGHVVFMQKWSELSNDERLELDGAFEKFLSETYPSQKMRDMFKRRDNAVAMYYNMRGDRRGQIPISALSQEQREYWLHKEEWFAEQVAKWMTTSEPVLTRYQKALKDVAALVRKAVEGARKAFGLSFEPNTVVADWLDSFIVGAPPFEVETGYDWKQEQIKENARVFEQAGYEGVPGVEFQSETRATDVRVRKLFSMQAPGGRPPRGFLTMKASADRVAKSYKWMVGVLQLAQLFPQVAPLQRYAETTRVMHNEEQRIFELAQRILRAWQELGTPEADRMAAAIADLRGMVYRTGTEIEQGVLRHPTAQERDDLIRRHNLTAEGIRALSLVENAYVTFVRLIQNEHIERARRRSTNLDTLVATIARINARFDHILSKPYFPSTRHGTHLIEVRNANNVVIFAEHVGREGLRSADAVQRRRVAELRPRLQPGETIRVDILNQQALPLIGMPGTLLELVREDLILTPQQEANFVSIGFDPDTVTRFQRRFRRPPSAEEAQRSFSYFFFHGGKWYSKARHVPGLRGHVGLLRQQAGAAANGKLLSDIANYLDNHLQEEIITPRTAITWLQGTTFFMYLGLMISTATLNLSQTPTMGFAWLGAKFGPPGIGDARAAGALVEAYTQMNTYYRRGNVARMAKGGDFEMRALSYAIQTGAITEAMAPELAAMAEGGNLISSRSSIPPVRWARWVYDKSPLFQELTEQINRRVTFRAALKLAMAYPGQEAERLATTANATEVEHLVGLGFTPAEAAAIVTAKYANEKIHYEYARYAQPRMFRGKKRTFFVFKTFIQNVVFGLLTNKSDVLPRYFAIMFFLGGLHAIPGVDDADELARVFAWWFLGKDFRLDREARKLIIQLSDGTIPPDLILNGVSRRGYGMSEAASMLGSTVGVDRVPFPILDRSRAMSPGVILPVELGKLLGPPVERGQEKVIADQIQRASGAAFGLGFNMYKFLADNDLAITDPKRWERVIPRFLASPMRAARLGLEGEERTRKGHRVLEYNIRTNPEHAMELIAMGLGYQPLRQSVKWNTITLKMEYEKALEIRRSAILEQMFKAQLAGSDKEIERVDAAIRRFNDALPDMARGRAITKDTVKRSMDGRMREKKATESGIPTQKSRRGIAEGFRELFPEAKIFEERVPKGAR